MRFFLVSMDESTNYYLCRNCAENGQRNQMHPLPWLKTAQVYGAALIMVDEQVKKCHLETEQLLAVLRVILKRVNF